MLFALPAKAFLPLEACERELILLSYFEVPMGFAVFKSEFVIVFEKVLDSYLLPGSVRFYDGAVKLAQSEIRPVVPESKFERCRSWKIS